MEVILYIVIGVVLGMAIAYVLLQKRLMQLNLELRQKATELHLLREQADKEAQLRAEKLAAQMDATKEQMTNLAQQLLERNAEKLKSENTDSIGQITQPLKEAIGEMRRELTQNRETSAANSATFQEQLRQMLESNERVGEKAANLAQAFRGDTKAQGNW